MVVSASRAEAVQETSAPTATVSNMEARPLVLVAGAQESGNSVDGDALAIINYRQMTLLANSGVTGLMSITGPKQGSPTFVVLQSLVTRLQQLEDSTLIPKTPMISSTPDCVIDPSLLGLSYTSSNNVMTMEDNIQNLLDTTSRAKRGKKRVTSTDLIASGYLKKRRVTKAEPSQPVGPTLRSAAKTQHNHGPEHSSSLQRTRGATAKLGNTYQWFSKGTSGASDQSSLVLIHGELWPIWEITAVFTKCREAVRSIFSGLNFPTCCIFILKSQYVIHLERYI